MGSLWVLITRLWGTGTYWYAFLADNVDYNELKNLVKIHTKKDAGQAIAIPGQTNAALAEFEELFFNELYNQHDRVDLFVKSKSFETESRLSKISFIPSYELPFLMEQ